ncbi:MAG: Type secretion protein [Verrucomicrobiales bacterium]|nr:Type secretion protein [Verrucomicrobiales bacterium]
MAEFQGEKSEHPTQKRIEESIRKGQFPRSAEVQTVLVLLGGVLAITFTGQETWRLLTISFTGTLGHLGEFPLALDNIQTYAIRSALYLGQCVWPIVVAAMVGGLLAGGLQTRFRTASEALSVNWERVDPIAGLKRIFSAQSAVPTLVAMLKLTVIIFLTYGQVQAILTDPIFYSAVSPQRVGQFLAQTATGVIFRVAGALTVIAAADYGYQFYKNSRDLMMTKEEVKEETKSSEGNPQVKARMRRNRQRITQRKMLLDVPKADVIVTNPTHLAIALRYDRKTMGAPRILAKGSRLNALRIREIAKQHQVPILENKPLARVMFKYGKVGGEIPAQLYAAVAEILAWVYRVNRYRYYTEQNQTYVGN